MMASEVTCGLKSLPEDMTTEHHGITQKCAFLSQGGLFEALLSSLFGFFLPAATSDALYDTTRDFRGGVSQALVISLREPHSFLSLLLGGSAKGVHHHLCSDAAKETRPTQTQVL